MARMGGQVLDLFVGNKVSDGKLSDSIVSFEFLQELSIIVNGASLNSMLFATCTAIRFTQGFFLGAHRRAACWKKNDLLSSVVHYTLIESTL